MTDLIRGVDLTRVNHKHLAGIIKSKKLAADKTTKSMVEALADHLVRVHKDAPESILGCEWCGGGSDLTFDRCPYCAKSDEESSAAAAGANPPAEGLPPEAKPDTKANQRTKQPSPKESETVHSGEIVATTRDLDTSTEEIKAIRDSIYSNYGLLGQKLKESYDRRLYTQRLRADGLPVYRNWDQYVRAELHIGPRYAYDLIAITKTFTADQIRDVEVSKLRVMVGIPDEAKRNRLVESARSTLVDGKPLTRQQLEREARPAKPETTDNKRMMTILRQEGPHRIALLASATGEPARSVDDLPTATQQEFNGVRTVYRLIHAEGVFVLEVEHTRDAAQPAKGAASTKDKDKDKAAKPKAAEAKPKAAEAKPKAAEAKPKAAEAKGKPARAKPANAAEGQA